MEKNTFMTLVTSIYTYEVVQIKAPLSSLLWAFSNFSKTKVIEKHNYIYAMIRWFIRVHLDHKWITM